MIFGAGTDIIEVARVEEKLLRTEHLKAMGTGWSGGHQFSDIEVINNALGKPELFVHGKVKEFCEAHGIGAMEVSLTHIKDVASAVVVLEKKTP